MASRKRARRVPGVLASFVHVDAAADAIRALRARGHRNLVVYSAAPNHEIEEALDHSVSPVRLFTLIGGLTGCAAGFGMTIWMSLDWPLLVGGKTDRLDPALRRHRVRAHHPARRAQHGRGRGAVLACSWASAGIAYDPALQRRPDRHLRAGRRPTRPGAVEQLLRSAGAVEVRHEAA